MWMSLPCSLMISNVLIFRWTVRKTREYSELWPRMCQNLPEAPGLSRDTAWHVTLWHYTGVASVTVSWVRGMCPQSGPIVPGPASSGQTEYFMRARVTGEGWFNGRCFNKIELYLITTQWNLEGGWNTLFMMSKGNLIKKKLSFLFVPTWDHLVFVDFCRLSTVKVRELHDEKIHIVTI